MKKKKKLFLVIGILFLLCLSAFVCVAFSNLILIGLSGDSSGFSFLSLLSIKGISENEEQRLIFFLSMLMCLVAIIAIFFMSRNKESFESDTTMLTDKITTPVAVGQGQHGTARWLKKEEMKKTYNQVTIDPNDKQLRSLIKQAEEERNYLFKEVNANEIIS